MLLVDPLPVAGPDVDVDVVDLREGVDALGERFVALAADDAFRSRGDQVVGVQRADKLGRLANPFGEGLVVLLPEGARFVAYLPREDRRVVGIADARVAVRAPHDEAHVIGVERPGPGIGDELRDVVHVGAVAVDGRDGCLARPGPGEVLRVTARPLPRIGQVEHRLHAAQRQLLHEVVEPVEQCVVVPARCGLEDRGYFGRNARGSLGADEHAQVPQAAGGERVQLALEAGAVSAGTFRSEDRAVPEVGADEVAGLVSEQEAPLFDADEVGSGGGCGVAAGGQQGAAGGKVEQAARKVGAGVFHGVSDSGLRSADSARTR